MYDICIYLVFQVELKLACAVTLVPPSSRELEEQAEDLQEMYDQRVHLLHRSMKKQFSCRKRRRPNDEEGEC